jgi:aerobic-type carbon monoxide dehydrogenase small subunit (CoxS/CutS family)
MLMSSAAFLKEDPAPKDIKEGIQGNICRCTGYNSILRAIKAVTEGKYEEEGR